MAEKDEERGIQPYQTQELSPREFDQALAYGQAKAQALKTLVDARHLYTEIGDKQYLQVEAWETIAEGYGMSARIEWSHPLEDGGWEAYASVVDRQGNIVGGAEAECGTEGDGNWIDRASFQQRSMAQTRAISKALRSRLSWVVVLAGYAPTPAEEMIAGDPTPKRGGENWCREHQAVWFKKGKMKNFAHPIGDTREWCNKPTVILEQDQPRMRGKQFEEQARTLGFDSMEAVNEALGENLANFLKSGGSYEDAMFSLKASQITPLEGFEEESQEGQV